MNFSEKRLNSRRKRHQRIRKSVFGTFDRPRLVVFRSSKHIYAQAIDDLSGVTLAAASTLEVGLEALIVGSTGGRAAAVLVGQTIAQKLLKKSVGAVVFDRGDFYIMVV